MNAIELDMMRGMVSILNEAISAHQSGTPIMTDEQFAVRSNDLAHLEAETGTVLLNSPHCAVDVRSIVRKSEIKEDALEECYDIKNIVEFSNQKELVAYVDVDGFETTIAYKNGVIDSIQISNSDEYVLNEIENLGIPCSIPKNEDYIVNGKIVIADKPIFYVTNIVHGECATISNNLNEAQYFGFDVIPNWVVSNLSQKSVQNSVDYIFEFAEEDGLCCRGVAFKLNNAEHSKMLSIMSPSFYNGIIIRRKEG